MEHKDSKKNILESVFRTAFESGLRDMMKQFDRDWPLNRGFITDFSYIFRSNLNAITGFSDILMHTDISSEYREYAESIYFASSRLIDSLECFKNYINLCNGTNQINKCSFSLREVLQDVEKKNLPVSKHLKKNFSINIEETVPDLIVSDPVLVRLCLSNLSNYVLTFTQEKQVELAVYIQLTESEKMICLSFRDESSWSDGGTDESFSSDLNDRKELVRNDVCAGIQINILNHILSLIDGRLEFDFSEEQARYVKMVIPLGYELTEAKYAEPEAELKKLSPKSAKTVRNVHDTDLVHKILVVDDDPGSLKIASMLTESFGFEVEQANCGEEAISKAMNENFGLILLDVWMEGTDGLEVARILRERGINVPIVALTADAMDETVDRCLESGIGAYIFKPIDRVSLCQILKDYFPEKNFAGELEI